VKFTQLSAYLPREENEESIRFILYTSVIITIIYCCLCIIVKTWKDSIRKGDDGESSSSVNVPKISYQLTNLLVNLTLGCLGIYYQINKIPLQETTWNKIVGYEHAKIFALGQIGYQLWALPIGLFVVGETKSVIVHHVAVICVASVSAFVRCGFRYYIPYFYGLIEISSVPLSIMNQFKQNEGWIRAYPEMYQTVRVVFAVTFLLVRVVLWTPFYWSFWAHATLLLYSSENISTTVILTVFNLSSLVLTFLQYFWASKIISAMVKRGDQSKKKES